MTEIDNSEFFKAIFKTPVDPNQKYPIADYNPHGDMLEITIAPGSYYMPYPHDNGIGRHIEHETGKLIGMTVYGLSKRLKLQHADPVDQSDVGATD